MTAKQIDGQVIRIIDGDTLSVLIRVRTRGSAPELGTAEGESARGTLTARFPPGTRVRLQPVAIDVYSRMVALVSRS